MKRLLLIVAACSLLTCCGSGEVKQDPKTKVLYRSGYKATLYLPGGGTRSWLTLRYNEGNGVAYVYPPEAVNTGVVIHGTWVIEPWRLPVTKEADERPGVL
jgi:hypothetical protein